MIFAEVSNETWMAGIAAAGAVFAGLFAMLSNRHKLQYDAKIVVLEAGNKECLEDRKILGSKVTELEGKLDDCQDHHDKADEQFGKVWAEIREIKGV